MLWLRYKIIVDNASCIWDYNWRTKSSLVLFFFISGSHNDRHSCAWIKEKKRRNQQHIIYYLNACTHAIVKFLNQGGHTILFGTSWSHNDRHSCVCVLSYFLWQRLPNICYVSCCSSHGRGTCISRWRRIQLWPIKNCISRWRRRLWSIWYTQKSFITSRYELISCEEGATTPPWITKRSFVFSGIIRWYSLAQDSPLVLWWWCKKTD